MKVLSPTALALLCSGVLCAPLFGAVVSWDGGQGTDNWSHSNNWSGNVLPTFLDDVIIGGGATVDQDITASVLSLAVTTNASLTIENGVVLNIDGSGPQAVHVNLGSLIIGGTLNILSYAGNGIVVENGSKVTNSGLVSIQNIIGGFGIDNKGIWNNFSSLIVNNIDARCLINQGLFDNQDTVKIALTNFVGSDGIYNLGTFTSSVVAYISIKDINETNSDGIENSGLINNYGTIDIEDIEYVGLACRSSSIQFNNFGQITINQSTRFGIEISGGTFVNNISGQIDITDIQADVLNVGKGISRLFTGAYINKGAINISNISGSTSEGLSGGLENEGTINIKNIFYRGIFIGQYTLQNSGTIEISNDGVLSTNAHAISSIDSIINEATGIIKISDHTLRHLDGIQNKGILINQGQIICDSLDLPIVNEDTLSLFHNSGVLKILRSRVGVTNNDRAQFINDGSIEIIEVFYDPTQGLLNNDHAVFHNRSLGYLRIDSMYGPISPGLLNISGAKLINDGTLIVKHISGTGLANVLEGEVFLQSGSTTTVSFCGLPNVDTNSKRFDINSGALLTIGYDDNSGDPLKINQNFSCDGILNVTPADDFIP